MGARYGAIPQWEVPPHLIGRPTNTKGLGACRRRPIGPRRSNNARAKASALSDQHRVSERAWSRHAMSLSSLKGLLRKPKAPEASACSRALDSGYAVIKITGN
jgi:hypothetical protein